MQVVGLTASLTYSCTDSAVKKSIEAIVRELQIVHMATGNFPKIMTINQIFLDAINYYCYNCSGC
jgi:hypothetical protein